MKRWLPGLLLTVAGALLVFGAGWAYYQWLPTWTSASRTALPAPPGARGRLYTATGLGRLEPAGGVVAVVGPPGDRVLTLHAREGDWVELGKPLADTVGRRARELEAKLLEQQIVEAEARGTAEGDLAAARVAQAKLAVSRAEAGPDRVEAAGKKVKLLEEKKTLEERALARFANVSEELISATEREQQALAVKKAEVELAAAKLEEQESRATSQFALASARAELRAAEAQAEQVRAAHAVESLRTQLALARERLAEAELRAPISGRVLKIHTRAGETLGSKPLLQMADTRTMVCVAEVYETFRHQVREGQRVKLRSDAFPDWLQAAGARGRVERLGSLVSLPALRSLSPTDPSDARVFEARVVIETPAGEPAGRRAARDGALDSSPDKAPSDKAPSPESTSDQASSHRASSRHASAGAALADLIHLQVECYFLEADGDDLPADDLRPGDLPAGDPASGERGAGPRRTP